MISCTSLKCHGFFFEPKANMLTKRGIVTAVTLIALGAIAIFLGALALQTTLHGLPGSFAFFGPVGTIGVEGGALLSSGGAIFLTTGILLSVWLVKYSRGNALPISLSNKPVIEKLKIDSSMSTRQCHDFILYHEDNEFSIHLLSDQRDQAAILRKTGVEIIPISTLDRRIRELSESASRISFEALEVKRKEMDKEIETLKKKLNLGEYFYHAPSRLYYIFEPDPPITDTQKPLSCWCLFTENSDSAEAVTQIKEINKTYRYYMLATVEQLNLRQDFISQPFQIQRTLDDERIFCALRTFLKEKEYIVYKLNKNDGIFLLKKSLNRIMIGGLEAWKNHYEGYLQVDYAEMDQRAKKRNEVVAPFNKLLNPGECFYYSEGQHFYGKKATPELRKEEVWSSPAFLEQEESEREKLSKEGYRLLSFQEIEQRAVKTIF